MIGRVPILYLPGFFWPGDEFFFNPNFGFDSREGSYIQTTTYLHGSKPKEDSPLSFLQIADSGDTGYTLEPHGLFLRKVPGTTTAPTDTTNLKLLLDAYSRLGVLAGLAGDYSPLATFRTAIGVSRTIFPTSAFGYPYDLYQTYTPFWVNADGTSQSYWNSSSLFGLVVPFRYGLEGTLQHEREYLLAHRGVSVLLRPLLHERLLQPLRGEHALHAPVAAVHHPCNDTEPTEPFLGSRGKDRSLRKLSAFHSCKHFPFRTSTWR